MENSKHRQPSTESPKQDKTRKKQLKQPLNDYAKYTGIAAKMAAIMIAGVYSGLKLDEWVAWEIPVFTLVLSIVSSAMAIYVIIKDVS